MSFLDPFWTGPKWEGGAAVPSLVPPDWAKELETRARGVYLDLDVASVVAKLGTTLWPDCPRKFKCILDDSGYCSVGVSIQNRWEKPFFHIEVVCSRSSRGIISKHPVEIRIWYCWEFGKRVEKRCPLSEVQSVGDQETVRLDIACSVEESLRIGFKKLVKSFLEELYSHNRLLPKNSWTLD